MRQAYGLAALDDEALGRLAESWRPFRTWVLVLLRSLADRPAGAAAPGA